jgi:hypothetical protein
MRRSGVFWGIVVILAGLILLVQEFYGLPAGFWPVFLSSMLILLGVWFLLGPILFKWEVKDVPVSVPLEGTAEGDIRIHYGAGKLQIGVLPDESSDLVSGMCTGGAVVDVNRGQHRTKVRLHTPDDVFWGLGDGIGPHGLAWDLGLNRRIPLRIKLDTGASENILELADLLVRELDMKTGASDTQVTLPAAAGQTRVEIHSGAASVNIRLPEGVAGRIHVESGLSSINVDTGRFPSVGDGFETPGFDTAANKAEITVKAGVGAIDIR